MCGLLLVLFVCLRGFVYLFWEAGVGALFVEFILE